MSSRQVVNEVGIPKGLHIPHSRPWLKKGFVKLDNFKKSPRKGQYAYLLTPKGIREEALLTHSLIARKREECKLLRAEINALEGEVRPEAEAAQSLRGIKQ
jgi:hypothetical protein